VVGRATQNVYVHRNHGVGWTLGQVR
jgi:hypothetical protein